MYLHWQEKIITDLSDSKVESLYNDGYVFTRIGKGVMHQTRSVRIDLSKFELSSENRRILKKVETLSLEKHSIPYSPYSWEIGKMAKDFYESRDADFSANKIKELLTDSSKSNFNTLLSFSAPSTLPLTGAVHLSHSMNAQDLAKLQVFASHPKRFSSGYAICYESPNIFHYSYPFYDLSLPKDTGLGMMLKAILWAQESGKKYFYLGSLQRPSDTYKLQFAGLEWFDGKEWQTDLQKAKEILIDTPK